MLRLAAYLPDAPVRLLPVLGGVVDLALEHRPERLGQLRPGPGVQVHRVEHGAPHVVLLLLVGRVADAYRYRVLVAGQVRQRLLVEFPLAADAVHDLQLVSVAAGVADEVEEVVGLPVEAERVQPPQGERGVAHPGVPVVPVAFAVRRLRQRGGRRGEQRSGRRVGEPLQGQRTALQVAAPRVVGEVAQGDPLAPVLGGAPHPLGRLGRRARRRQRRPGQRDVVGVPLDHPGTGVEPAPFDARPHVGGQPQRDAAVIGGRHQLAPA